MFPLWMSASFFFLQTCSLLLSGCVRVATSKQAPCNLLLASCPITYRKQEKSLQWSWGYQLLGAGGGCDKQSQSFWESIGWEEGAPPGMAGRLEEIGGVSVLWLIWESFSKLPIKWTQRFEEYEIFQVKPLAQIQLIHFTRELIACSPLEQLPGPYSLSCYYCC